MVDGTPDFTARLSELGSTDFSELRPGQRLILDEYARHHLGTKDLAIEMPTGAGKTLVALLIADFALDRGWSVAYLTGTRQLAENVEAEAQRLGLDVVRFSSGSYGGARLDDYHQAQVVGVMNYWVYFNSSPVPEPADLVIFDDAHLAEQPLSGLQTIRVPDKAGPARDLYRALIGLVLGHTDAYAGLPAMLDGTSAPGTPPELLSFVDWAVLAPAARETIEGSEFLRDDDARYAWSTVREHPTHCGVLIGSSAIEIRPYHPPTALNPQYYKARQRLYMSATLGSMDDLQRRTGGMPITRLVPETPLPLDETGTRKLILNSTSGHALDPEVLAWAISHTQMAGGRAAWLCSSHAEADALTAALNAEGLQVFRLRSGDDSAIGAWARSTAGQLVTAGRYDGLDFAGDMCRLVVITTVPQGSSEFERFVVAYIGDASYMRHRVGQRITQA
uniref:DEAD/DEAH box helicase n=1 Tax=Pseudactinotalea sp. TaxID=1926260 RepID=UPI003B3A7012